MIEQAAETTGLPESVVEQIFDYVNDAEDNDPCCLVVEKPEESKERADKAVELARHRLLQQQAAADTAAVQLKGEQQ